MAQLAPAQQVPFVWEGTDKKGKRIKGKMLAVSEAAVKADLRRQGVLAKRVRKESQLFKSGKKITSEDIALFARQLATMLQAGIPMVQCFDIIGNGHDKPAMQKLVLAVKGDDIVDQACIGGQKAHNTIPPAFGRGLVRQNRRRATEMADLNAEGITSLLLRARQAGNSQRGQRLMQATSQRLGHHRNVHRSSPC